MNDYERVATVIRFLDRHHTDQPDLNELAAAAGLSPFHFHRLFSAWAGVTPKDFLQCLTLEHVKQLLRHGDNVFDAALNAGLSGPGRLHDLCVTLEAASPGEMKNGGAGMQIDYGFAETAFGEALIAETKRGICHLSFVDGHGRNSARDLLTSQWPNAKLNRNDVRIADLAAKIFMQACDATRRPTLRLARAVARSVRFTHDLRAACRGSWPIASRSRSWERGRRQSHCVYHPVPSRHSRNRRARKLSLGSDPQTRHPRMGTLLAGFNRYEWDRSNQGHCGLTANLRSTSPLPRIS
jgi:AraC-like DNA-binding protein